VSDVYRGLKVFLWLVGVFVFSALFIYFMVHLILDIRVNHTIRPLGNGMVAMPLKGWQVGLKWSVYYGSEGDEVRQVAVPFYFPLLAPLFTIFMVIYCWKMWLISKRMDAFLEMLSFGSPSNKARDISEEILKLRGERRLWSWLFISISLILSIIYYTISTRAWNNHL
jgi:hypothetical protein